MNGLYAYMYSYSPGSRDDACCTATKAFLWSLVTTDEGLIIKHKFDSPFMAFMAARCVDTKRHGFLSPGSITSKIADLKYLIQSVVYHKVEAETLNNQKEFPRYVSALTV